MIIIMYAINIPIDTYNVTKLLIVHVYVQLILLIICKQSLLEIEVYYTKANNTG